MIAAFFAKFSLRKTLYALAAVGAIWLGCATYNAIDNAIENAKQIIVLEGVIEDQKDAIRILQESEAQRIAAQEAADAARAELEALQSTYDEIRRGIATSPEEDDGEIAPVLRRTLDQLGGL